MELSVGVLVTPRLLHAQVECAITPVTAVVGAEVLDAVSSAVYLVALALSHTVGTSELLAAFGALVAIWADSLVLSVTTCTIALGSVLQAAELTNMTEQAYLPAVGLIALTIRSNLLIFFLLLLAGFGTQ